MFDWNHPRFSSAKLQRAGVATALLLLLATPGACTRESPRGVPGGIQQQRERDRELSQIRLDPATCPDGGDGMLYVALGDVVVRVRHFSAPIMRNPVYSSADELPVARMPDAPEGCKEHPARAQAFHLTFLVAQSEDHIARPLRAISLLRADERVYMQEANEHLFDQWRERGKCTVSPSGLTICGRRSGDLPRSTGVQAASGDIGAAQQWVAVCGTGSLLVDDCSVTYLLRKGLVVRYRFNQQETSLQRVFELDASVREWINSMVVDNYPWP